MGAVILLTVSGILHAEVIDFNFLLRDGIKGVFIGYP